MENQFHLGKIPNYMRHLIYFDQTKIREKKGIKQKNFWEDDIETQLLVKKKIMKMMN